MKYIYSEQHKGLMSYPIMPKPKWNVIGTTAKRNEQYVKDMDEYNKWLSTPPISVRDEDIEWFRVAREEGVEFKIKSSRIKGVVFDMKLVAIPIVKDVPKTFEAEYAHAIDDINTDKASLASHSCTVGNSIEQGFKIEYKALGRGFNVIIQAKNLNAALLRFAKYYHELEEIYSVQPLLNSEQSVKVSDTTEADSSNSAG
jgi:hypothetical protein